MDKVMRLTNISTITIIRVTIKNWQDKQSARDNKRKKYQI